MQEIKTSIETAPSASLLNRFFDNDLEKKKNWQSKRTIVTTVAGDGTAGLVDGPAPTAKFKSPLDVVVHGDGTIYVADGFNSCIRKISDGMASTFAGNGNANIKNGDGFDARFKIPCRLASDVAGNLYLLDAADPRIRKITPSARVSIYAGTSTFGFRDGDVSTAQFGQSFGIAFDAQQNIYIGDSQNDCIRKISSDGQVATLAGAGIGNQKFLKGNVETINFYFIKAVVVDKQGNLFVADLNRIRKVTPAGVVSTFFGNSKKESLDGIPETAWLTAIEDMVMDDRENIYLLEGNRILKITPERIVSTVAGSIAGYEDGDAISSKFNQPKGLCVDAKGNIYVADSNNNRIRKISFV
jgi:sugar lactone lactonase YvrE